MLACRVVCISHQSDCRIRVCIAHQSNHSIWVSCINHSVQILFSCKLCRGIRRLCTKNDIDQKFWVYLINVMIVSSLSEAEIYRDMKGSHLFHCIIFELKHVFSASFLTTHMSNNLHSITYYEILSFSLAQCIFPYTKLQYVLGQVLLEIQQFPSTFRSKIT